MYLMVEVLITLSCLTLCDPTDWGSPGSLSMGFSRQEYWSGLPFPSPGDLPDPGIKPRPPALQTPSLLCEPARKFSHKFYICLQLFALQGI